MATAHSMLFGACLVSVLTKALPLAIAPEHGAQSHELQAMWAAVVATAIFGVLHMLVAESCWQARRRGRIGSLVLAVALLALFPLGTLVGVYLLVESWQPFAQDASAGDGPTPTRSS